MTTPISSALLAAALFTVTYAVNLQAPLYSVYAAHSGAGAAAVTLAFAAYAAGLVPVLLLLGGLSDRTGRRLPIAAALLLGLAATALLAAAPSWPALVAARVMLGAGTGLATTAGTAFMAELLGEAKSRQAALLVASATSLGFGGGALATGVSLDWQGPTTLPASFIALFVLAPVLAAAALALPRAGTRRAAPLLRLPVFPAGTWPYGTALALAWSATGMTIAVLPLQLEAQGLGARTGLVIFLAIFTGFLCQPLARALGNRAALLLGYALVPLGFLLVLGGVWSQSLLLILSGTALTSAASYGFVYLSALSEFSQRAPGSRARAAAGLFVYAYAGFSLPVILSGALADWLGLLPALAVFQAFLLAGSALAAALWRLRARSGQTAPA
ncbi:MFS transporter [Leisingera thetidis]|uniref:MFS transporter n=1 Tax=Leisingera thetidis TaxID=2930199 RepID=UPI0021F80042|nr:MFS transporter [Leisingera thetidis]